MHSADYAYRGKMSVCLSVTRRPVFCLNGYILRVFLSSGSPTILVFQYQTGWQYSDGIPPVIMASNSRGVKKNYDFQPISRLIWEMMQDRAIVTMECE